MDQHSPQPLEGPREVTTIRDQSQSMHFELPTSNSVNEDNWEQEMIRAKNLDQEKVGGHLVAHSEAWNHVTHDTFVLSLVQGHLIQFNCKPRLVCPTEKCKVQVPKGQQQEMSDSDAVEGREYRGSAKQQGLLYIPIPDPKEEWQQQIHYEPKTIESVHKMHQIQDDDPETDQRVSQEQAMGCSDGYQISVLPRSNASQTKVFPAFSIQGEGLPFQDSPIWLINSSENVHSMHTANTSILPQARDNAVPLSRRCISPEWHLWPGQEKWSDHSQVAPRPQLCPKSREMQLRTNTSVHAPRSDVEHKDNDAIATSGEGSSNSETSLTCSEESEVSCCSTSLGADELCEYCHTTCQAAIATTTVVAETALQRSIGHVQTPACNGGSSPQSRMVALLQVTSQEYSQAFSPRSRNDRCFKEGLQRRMQPASLSRWMARE